MTYIISWLNVLFIGKSLEVEAKLGIIYPNDSSTHNVYGEVDFNLS